LNDWREFAGCAAAKALAPPVLPKERVPRTPTKVSWTVYPVGRR
jgi:hypothetical protein